MRPRPEQPEPAAGSLRQNYHCFVGSDVEQEQQDDTHHDGGGRRWGARVGGRWRVVGVEPMVGRDTDQRQTTTGQEGPGSDAKVGDGNGNKNLEKRQTTKMELSPKNSWM
jgi:hypothetical protein